MFQIFEGRSLAAFPFIRRSLWDLILWPPAQRACSGATRWPGFRRSSSTVSIRWVNSSLHLQGPVGINKRSVLSPAARSASTWSSSRTAADDGAHGQLLVGAAHGVLLVEISAAIAPGQVNAGRSIRQHLVQPPASAPPGSSWPVPRPGHRADLAGDRTWPVLVARSGCTRSGMRTFPRT